MGKKLSLTLALCGLVAILLLCLLFGGFGYWALPGLILLALGCPGLVGLSVRKRSYCFRTGSYLAFCGAAVLLGTLPHVMLGLGQMLGLLLLLLGLVLLFLGRKKPGSCPGQ